MSSQAELKNRLKVLLDLPENQSCVDCNDGQPRCASLIVPPPGAPTNTPIGALCCLECSGSHRKLGAHVAWVRSISLDTWNDKEVYSLETWGNTKVNALFEARLPRINDKPTTTAKGWTRERFIRDKYERRRFYDELVFKTIEEEELKSDRKLQQHQHHRSKSHKTCDEYVFSDGQNMDWASDMFSGHAAVPIEPLKERVTDDSLFSESSDFSDFESEGGGRHRRKKAHGRVIKLNDLDTDSSERSKKARSSSNRPPPQNNGKNGSIVPCFQLDSNKSQSWGLSVDDVDDDFEPSEFETEGCTSDDSCGLRAQQKLLFFKEEESKMTADERKAAKRERRKRRQAIRIRRWLEIDGSESDDEMSSHGHPKVSRTKKYTRQRKTTNINTKVSNSSGPDDRSSHLRSNISNSTKAPSPHNEKTAQRRIFSHQGSERSLSTGGSGGSKNSTKPIAEVEQKLNSPKKNFLEGVLEESLSETVDDAQRGRGAGRNQSAGNHLGKARGRSQSRNTESSEDRERSQSQASKSGRSESRSQNHSRSRSRRRETSRSRAAESVNSLKKTSLLGGDDSDASDDETGLFRKKKASNSIQPGSGKPTSSRGEKKQVLSPRMQADQQSTDGTGQKISRRDDQEHNEKSRDSFDPFADDFSTPATKSSVADPPGFTGQRNRRAAHSFGQSRLNHATNNTGSCTSKKVEVPVTASVRHASAGLGAGPGPALRPPSADDNVMTTKISRLEPPKHDKAADNIFKNRRLRGVEHGRTQPSTTKTAFEASFSKFQN